MKKITCEMCGSTEFVKKDGFMECQGCGTKYTVEEAKKLMFEGTFSINRNDEIENNKILAFRNFKNQDYTSAINNFDKILELDPNNWEALFYSNYCKFENNVISMNLYIKSINDTINLLQNNKTDDEIKSIIELLCLQIKKLGTNECILFEYIEIFNNIEKAYFGNKTVLEKNYKLIKEIYNSAINFNYTSPEFAADIRNFCLKCEAILDKYNQNDIKKYNLAANCYNELKYGFFDGEDSFHYVNRHETQVLNNKCYAKKIDLNNYINKLFIDNEQEKKEYFCEELSLYNKYFILSNGIYYPVIEIVSNLKYKIVESAFELSGGYRQSNDGSYFELSSMIFSKSVIEPLERINLLINHEMNIDEIGARPKIEIIYHTPRIMKMIITFYDSINNKYVQKIYKLEPWQFPLRCYCVNWEAAKYISLVSDNYINRKNNQNTAKGKIEDSNNNTNGEGFVYTIVFIIVIIFILVKLLI